MFGLAISREKRVPKTKNMFGVTHKPIYTSRNQHKHGNDPTPKSPIRSGLVDFLAFSRTCKLKLAVISQIFVCLAVLTIPTNVWAQEAQPDVTVVRLEAIDTDGDDEIFNGTNQKLRITVGVTGGAHGEYTYTLEVDGRSIIGAGPHTLKKDQSQIHEWSGENFREGVHTIQLTITEADGFPVEHEQILKTVILDKTPPRISIGPETAEFSPNGDRVLDRIDVFYGTNEGLKESRLEFFLRAGENKTPFGQSVNLSTGEGSHRYVWNGGNRGSTAFPDGQYILKFRVVDKGGNTAEVESIPVTIDTKAPLISRVAVNENLTLVDGTFINAPIQSIKVTADAAGGTPLDFTANQTSLQVKKQGGATIKGDLSTMQQH